MNQQVFESGTVLQQRYKIERLIARGGMGAVYQATDQRLGSLVALKQIILDHPRLHRAFEREARLLAGLHHPALPVVSDYFTGETGRFLVMQYIAGDDLGLVLDRQPDTFTSSESFPQVLDWADRLLDALDYLHTREPPIIHRDIKPQNLKLTPRGEIVLLDFGLAKSIVDAESSTTSGHSVRAYTTDYAPFEQIQGTGTDARSDIYALGATIYHLLTGHPPANSLSRAVAVLGGKPDPLVPAHLANQQVSPMVAAVLLEAMANGMSRRFPTAAAMRTALRTARSTSAPPDHAPTTLIQPLPQGSGSATIVATDDAPSPAPQLPAPLKVTPAITHLRPAVTEIPVAPILVVDPVSGLYRSIGAAIANAQPGSRIVVRPGHYAEQLVLDKPLELIGDGLLSDIVVEYNNASCLVMQTDYALVRGLTLQSTLLSDEQADYPTIDIPQGRLVLERCHIASQARVGIAFYGAFTNPVIWRCQIHDARMAGILVADSARGTIEECDLVNNGNAGIAIRNGGNPVIRGCRLYAGGQDGIYVGERSSGFIEQCDIFDNARAGIEITHESTPLVRQCNIRNHTQGYGIYMSHRGAGIVEACDISNSGKAGIGVLHASSPLIRFCHIHNERQRGILVAEGSQGTIEHCDIVGNERVGIDVRQGSNPMIQHCTIQQHGIVAVWVHEQSSARVEDCNLTLNARGPWHVEEGSRVLRYRNQE